MTKKVIQFPSSATTFYFDASFEYIQKLAEKQNIVIITDETIFNIHKKKFSNYKIIVLKAGEAYKNQKTVNTAIDQLIKLGADRKIFIVGIGGGVVTDMAGYIAGIYMRGLRFGFVPTTILAMVDASIGGKNGIDVGVYKNMVGLIKQPEFILYDYSFLKTLPKQEWVNGFAEIIKHACIKDAAMFKLLEDNKLASFQRNSDLLNQLIKRNALLKSKVVAGDEFESGDRKLLNFGHTLGHAIENMYQLPHGFAVSIGMVAAIYLSEQLVNFKDVNRVIDVLTKYGLPVHHQYNAAKAIKMMQADKKRLNKNIHYILLKRIGKAIVEPLSFEQVTPVLQQFSKAS